jgi:uncharacterized protein (DUF983 family)
MALKHKTKKRLALLILIIGIPAYIVAAVSIVNLFERPSIWVEFGIYVALGIVWALPLRAVFKGVGQADPEAPDQ